MGKIKFVIYSANQMESKSATRAKFNSIFETVDVNHRRTKIICTLGQASEETDMMVKMIDAGMDVACLNFAQGDHKSHGQELDNIRDTLKQRPDRECATMMLTKGPEIKSGNLRDQKPITL